MGGGCRVVDHHGHPAHDGPPAHRPYGGPQPCNLLPPTPCQPQCLQAHNLQQHLQPHHAQQGHLQSPHLQRRHFQPHHLQQRHLQPQPAPVLHAPNEPPAPPLGLQDEPHGLQAPALPRPVPPVPPHHVPREDFHHQGPRREQEGGRGQHLHHPHHARRLHPLQPPPGPPPHHPRCHRLQPPHQPPLHPGHPLPCLHQPPLCPQQHSHEPWHASLHPWHP